MKSEGVGEFLEHLIKEKCATERRITPLTENRELYIKFCSSRTQD